ncbi:MAG: HipA N-terminal domain-containing protein [Legionellales bacterium]|nr:HipA N-terminal domain-containing protein [Legionellales bacterium]
MNNDRLIVWYEEKLVGELTPDNQGEIGFQYHDTWLDHGFAISQQLPLTSEKYLPTSKKAHNFFANLLPEGSARTHIIRDLKIIDNALLYKSNQQIQLAPFYDLVCTRAIARIDSKLAFAVGDKFNPNTITVEDWTQLAHACDIKSHYLIKLVNELAITLKENFSRVKEEFEKVHGSYPALQRVEKIIITQCNRTLKRFHNH